MRPASSTGDDCDDGDPVRVEERLPAQRARVLVDRHHVGEGPGVVERRSPQPEDDHAAGHDRRATRDDLIGCPAVPFTRGAAKPGEVGDGLGPHGLSGRRVDAIEHAAPVGHVHLTRDHRRRGRDVARRLEGPLDAELAGAGRRDGGLPSRGEGVANIVAIHGPVAARVRAVERGDGRRRPGRHSVDHTGVARMGRGGVRLRAAAGEESEQQKEERRTRSGPPRPVQPDGPVALFPVFH